MSAWLLESGMRPVTGHGGLCVQPQLGPVAHRPLLPQPEGWASAPLPAAALGMICITIKARPH